MGRARFNVVDILNKTRIVVVDVSVVDVSERIHEPRVVPET
jgi:hypothetical protein